MCRLACAHLLSLALTLGAPAFAIDGVREINQTCAGLTGCFPGDTAGLPVTISSPGSYRLTSNLLVPNTFTDGIVVSTSSVSIDLNGFEISGPVVCSGIPLTCSPSSGDGSGIERVSNEDRGISVKNGSITGMGSAGVTLGSQAEVTNLRVRWNRAGGISVHIGSTVSDNTAYQNGGYGINGESGSTVSGNTVYQNRTYGIGSESGSTVSGNSASQNGSHGIYVLDGSTVSDNTVFQNDGDGIRTLSGCTVKGNTVRGNADYGLNLGSQTGYRENVITSNADGTVFGSSLVNLGNNTCNGSTVCP